MASSPEHISHDMFLKCIKDNQWKEAINLVSKVNPKSLTQALERCETLDSDLILTILTYLKPNSLDRKILTQVLNEVSRRQLLKPNSLDEKISTYILNEFSSRIDNLPKELVTLALNTLESADKLSSQDIRDCEFILVTFLKDISDQELLNQIFSKATALNFKNIIIQIFDKVSPDVRALEWKTLIKNNYPIWQLMDDLPTNFKLTQSEIDYLFDYAVDTERQLLAQSMILMNPSQEKLDEIVSKYSNAGDQPRIAWLIEKCGLVLQNQSRKKISTTDPETADLQDIAAILKIQHIGFKKELEYFEEIIDTLKEKKSKNPEKYTAVLDQAFKSHGILEHASKDFFANPNPDLALLKTFKKTCEKAITDATNVFKNHRGLWYSMDPIFRGFLGVLAVLTVIPALAVEITSVVTKSSHSYKHTFFSEPKTDTLKQFERVADNEKTILEGIESTIKTK